MTKKVLELIGCCNDCPRKVYYSGGRSECTEAGTVLPYNEGHSIPDWCPLIPYPSGMVERRDDTIRDLRSQLEAARDPAVITEAALTPAMRRLIIAARVVMGDQSFEAMHELDGASEAFAEAVPWDDEPAPPTEG